VFAVKSALPDWLRARLEAAGVQPINNVVDVTSYVMLGSACMHAFDLERLATGESSCVAPPPEKRFGRLTASIGSSTKTLVIADTGRAIAIGGVMGGANSEVSATTQLIALESAYFEPTSVRRTSKRLGLKTEASTRFERGGDIDLPPKGIARATELFAQVAAGAPLTATIDRYPVPRLPRTIELRSSRIARLLGQDVPDADVSRFLRRSGSKSITPRRRAWSVTVPTFQWTSPVKRISSRRSGAILASIGCR
jgi:phenylalanyl-tRNA synthetase beta chain